MNTSEKNYGRSIAYILLLLIALSLILMIIIWIALIETSILKDVWGTKFSIILGFYILFPLMNLLHFINRIRSEKRFFIDSGSLNYLYIILWDSIAVAYTLFLLLDGHSASSLQNYLLLNYDSEVASKFVQETKCFDITAHSCWSAAGRVVAQCYTNFVIAFILLSIIQVPSSIAFIF